MQTHQTDYRAINPVGRVLHSFGSLDLARDWAKANETLHPGVEVHEVITTVTSRRVYRPRPAIVEQRAQVAA